MKVVQENEGSEQFPAPTKEKKETKESQEGTSSNEENPGKKTLHGHGAVQEESVVGLRRRRAHEFDCCLFEHAEQYGLTPAEAPRVIGPYCERRKLLGWCFDKQTCHDSVMKVIRKVNKHTPRNYGNYLAKSLQEYLIENADNMKPPRVRQYTGSEPECIDDVLKEAGLP